MSEPYCDVEIQVRPPIDGVYPVAVHVPSEDRRAEGSFVSPYSPAEVERALGWMEQGLFDAEYVKAWGAKLFAALFTGAVKAVYEGSRQSAGLPLRIRMIIDAPSAARIPWELLYDPDRQVFVSLEGPFVRGTSIAEASDPLVVQPPLRILIVDAFPAGVPTVQHQVETAGIKQALAELTRRRLVEVETLAHATLAALQNALREAADPALPRPFHLLHFIGHGQHDAVSGRTVLLFEDDAGQIDEVDPDALLNVLRPFDLKLVVLNACQSLQSSALDLAQGFAPALLRSGVPAVIGMQVTVLDQVALAFSRHFYAALADNRPVDAALADARQLARGTRHRRKADLGIPVCYLRTPNGRILDVQRPARIPLTLATWRPWLRERATPRRIWGGLVGVLGFVATLLGLYWGIVPFFEGPAPMTGAFNVAVAEFGVVDAPGETVAAPPGLALAEAVYVAIDTEVKALQQSGSLEGFHIELRRPDELGRIAGATTEQRARSAAALAERFNIDVIVYGNLALGDEATGFVPEFYLSARTLRNAEELVGQYNFGTQVERPGNVMTNPVVSKELSEALSGRTSALTQFVIGLGYYTLDRFDRAAEYFAAADQTPGWDAADGKEVLYLYRGNAANKLRDLPRAAEFYERALRLNDEYARAHIGAAEVRFLTARGETCAADRIDRDGLAAAITGFRAALAAAEQPPRAAIGAKVAFGLGRSYLCLSIAGVEDRWDAAADQFGAVIADYEADQDRVKRELASEASANLGLLAWLRPVPADTLAASYREAIDHYRRAIELSRLPQRKALFHSMLGQLHHRLGETEASRQAFNAAIALDPERQSYYEQLRDQLGFPTHPVTAPSS